MAKYFPGKIVADLRQYGPVNFTKRITISLLGKAGFRMETYLIHSIALEQEFKLPKIDPAYQAGPLTLDDFSNDKSGYFSEEKLELLKERLNSKDFFPYGIRHGAELVYSFWISLAQVELNFSSPAENILSLQEDEGYLVDAYCAPAYRGKGFHTYMTIYLLNELRKMGKKRGIIIIIKENTAALRSTRNVGFVHTKTLRYTSIFGRERFKVEQVSPLLNS